MTVGNERVAVCVDSLARQDLGQRCERLVERSLRPLGLVPVNLDKRRPIIRVEYSCDVGTRSSDRCEEDECRC